MKPIFKLIFINFLILAFGVLIAALYLDFLADQEFKNNPLLNTDHDSLSIPLFGFLVLLIIVLVAINMGIFLWKKYRARLKT